MQHTIDNLDQLQCCW